MFNLVYSPQWFYDKDIIIDIVSVVAVLFIAFFALRCYQLNTKKKSFLYLTLSYFLIGISFVFKILTNFSIYHHVVEKEQFGVFVIYETTHYAQSLFALGFLLHRLLMLLGLYLLYLTYQEKNKVSTVILGVFLIVVSTYFTQVAYFIFHLTSLLLLVFITLIYKEHCCKCQDLTTKMLWLSFALIGISQIFFIFVGLEQFFYVIAEVVQLLGFIFLLLTFIQVLRYGKKKITHGHHQ